MKEESLLSMASLLAIVVVFFFYLTALPTLQSMNL